MNDENTAPRLDATALLRACTTDLKKPLHERSYISMRFHEGSARPSSNNNSSNASRSCSNSSSNATSVDEVRTQVATPNNTIPATAAAGAPTSHLVFHRASSTVALPTAASTARHVADNIAAIRMGAGINVGRAIPAASSAMSSSSNTNNSSTLAPEERGYRKGILNATNAINAIKMQAQRNVLFSQNIDRESSEERERRRIIERDELLARVELRSAFFAQSLLLVEIAESQCRCRIQDAAAVSFADVNSAFSAAARRVAVEHEMFLLRRTAFVDFVDRVSREERAAWYRIMCAFAQDRLRTHIQQLERDEVSCRRRLVAEELNERHEQFVLQHQWRCDEISLRSRLSFSRLETALHELLEREQLCREFICATSKMLWSQLQVLEEAAAFQARIAQELRECESGADSASDLLLEQQQSEWQQIVRQQQQEFFTIMFRSLLSREAELRTALIAATESLFFSELTSRCNIEFEQLLRCQDIFKQFQRSQLEAQEADQRRVIIDDLRTAAIQALLAQQHAECFTAQVQQLRREEQQERLVFEHDEIEDALALVACAQQSAARAIQRSLERRVATLVEHETETRREVACEEERQLTMAGGGSDQTEDSSASACLLAEIRRLNSLAHEARTSARPFVGFSLVERGTSESFSRRRTVHQPLIVDSLFRGGPADNAGLCLGDTVLAVAGEKATSLVDVRKRIVTHGAVGGALRLRVRRATVPIEERVAAVKKSTSTVSHPGRLDADAFSLIPTPRGGGTATSTTMTNSATSSNASSVNSSRSSTPIAGRPAAKTTALTTSSFHELDLVIQPVLTCDRRFAELGNSVFFDCDRHEKVVLDCYGLIPGL